jgi:diguanylate cyclase (GGDEF)-like protein
MLDCNNFKYINDTYGHKTGDKVLRNIAGVLVKSTRTSDIVVRYGGDEFMILAPFTDEMGTKIVLRRIEERLEKLSQKLGVEISLSVGTAIYPIDGKNIELLIQHADEKMYQAKSTTRKQTKASKENTNIG